MADGDFFVQGDFYTNTTGIPRTKRCETCAFKEGPGTVRPEGVSIAEVIEQSRDCYDFVCHTANDDGSFPSCALWATMTQQDRRR